MKQYRAVTKEFIEISKDDLCVEISKQRYRKYLQYQNNTKQILKSKNISLSVSEDS